ncbi:superoxide dismutase [Mn] [Desulfosarcina alkanivorans]|uniref:Superoxide dismutase n=1 Tax=Desulfosarcina alkanivorans TaxID=571177 RepID=A0A5K7YJ69_9BACT|nr:superoxide dismutase [Desulfosarcina alkanivorans]BBO68563.1 superoxide dismutase [Mn] [Desulfosarcina alkanivorans]
MNHTLPGLPYAYDALEPFIDARTMEIHHTRHHQTYVDKLNAALEGHEALHDKTAEALLKDLDAVPEGIRTAVRNHAGGHANHAFWWPMLKKEVPFSGPVAEAVTRQFGSYEKFKDAFSSTAALLFGSGWVWLALDRGKLEIVATPNQDSPVSRGKTPVMGIDVWEHAYYLKYQNRRPAYIDAFFKVVDWERVNDIYVAAAG